MNYRNQLTAMTDKELLEETKKMIWFSSCDCGDSQAWYDEQLDACKAECQKRDHSWIYDKAKRYWQDDPYFISVETVGAKPPVAKEFSTETYIFSTK